MALSKKRQKNAELLKAMRNPNEPIPPALNELEKLSGKVYAKLKRDASEWYRMEKGKKDYKAYVLEYAKNTRPDQFKIIKQNPDWRFSPVLGSMCRMKTRGWPDFVHAEDEYWQSLPGTTGNVKPLSAWIEPRMDELYESGLKVTEVEDDKPKVVRRSPIELYKEKVWDTVMTDVINMEDDWIDGKHTTIDIYALYQKYGLTSKANPIVEEQINRWLEEYTELLKVRNQKPHINDWDAQLVEGYSHLSDKEVKFRIKTIESIHSDLERIKKATQTTRKSRVKKPQSAERQVRNLNYEKENHDYKVVSLNPMQIIGMHRLLVFSTKYCRIEEYISERVDGFEIKGQALQHITKSRGKKLRKPMEFLPIALSKTERQFDKEFEKLTTKEYKPNGRFNKALIILKADKRR